MPRPGAATSPSRATSGSARPRTPAISQPLRDFHAAAAALVKERAAAWTEIVERGPVAQAAHSLDITRALARGDAAHLASAAVSEAPALTGERGFGMCGRLRAYDVSDPRGLR